jgi:polyhydroxybutyrate depolymerase
MGRERRVPARRAGLIALVLVATVMVATAIGTGRGGDECGVRRPLVVDLHGYSETVAEHERVTGLRRFAEEHDFIVITPQADGSPPAWDLDGDVDTIAGAIDAGVGHLCADADRVYLVGYSMGGFLVSHGACELSDRVAAVATVAGVWPVAPCRQSRPVPVLALHGTADETVPFDGGLHPLVAEALDLPVDGPSVSSLVRRWAARNECTGDAVVATEGTVTSRRFGCARGADVELDVFEGGAHTWPASANERIWAFFERHALTSS